MCKVLGDKSNKVFRGVVGPQHIPTQGNAVSGEHALVCVPLCKNVLWANDSTENLVLCWDWNPRPDAWQAISSNIRVHNASVLKEKGVRYKLVGNDRQCKSRRRAQGSMQEGEFHGETPGITLTGGSDRICWLRFIEGSHETLGTSNMQYTP